MGGAGPPVHAGQDPEAVEFPEAVEYPRPVEYGVLVGVVVGVVAGVDVVLVFEVGGASWYTLIELMSQYLLRVSHGHAFLCQGDLHVRKRAWGVCNKSRASRNTSRSCAAITPGSSSPVTTECNVKDYLLVDEVGIDITVPLEVCGRETPGIWSRRTSLDIFRNSTAWPEPDLDVVGHPLHGVHATLVGVETETVAV